MMDQKVTTNASRHDTLSALLEADPTNTALLSDTADAAFAEERWAETIAAVERLDKFARPSPERLHQAGLSAMRLKQWSAAADWFARAMEDGVDEPAIRFNRGWSLAMANDLGPALEMVDRPTAEALPQAAQLRVQLMHDRGEVDAAMAEAEALLMLHPDHRGLNAVVATLAIDAEDVDLAERCAMIAGDHPDALTTMGTLALDRMDGDAAARFFDQALAREPSSPRAWIGRGLARMTGENSEGAAAEIDRGAEMFGTHLGSWIAAGWAHFLAGDAITARTRFEKALSIDDSFAESHGALAVMDLMAGDTENAHRRLEVARRLDRECFSAALASMLLAAGSGDADRARAIFERALDTPIDEHGRTLASALAKTATRTG